MHVLIIGSGGREHALVNAIVTSPLLTRLSVAPGNAGTAAYNVMIDVAENAEVVQWCQVNAVDLVIVGPEVPLVNGLADAMGRAGVACFGPSQAAAQLEGSKAFTREFADRVGIPSPISRSFTATVDAAAWLDETGFDVVVKADGLAAGKGVIIPNDRDETIRAIESMLDGDAFGSAGQRVVLEERISGEEVSLFGISDGSTVVALATAQDHKRVGDGDLGPNTGGMGAFAPVPGIDANHQAELAQTFLQVAIEGMAAEGTPYVGVLYAGVMLTAAGPKLIEYNCRFGDPECQVVLPLVDTDVLLVLDAAANGRLDEIKVDMRHATAATVVVCAEGYPENPRRGIPIPEPITPEGVTVLHAGTARDAEGQLVSKGGRVLAVTAVGDDLDDALRAIYKVVDEITGDGLFARGDIGWRHSNLRSSK